MTEQIAVPISRALLDSIDNLDAFKAEIVNRLSLALQREMFDGLTLAEYEDQLLNGTGEGVPIGIINARVK